MKSLVLLNYAWLCHLLLQAGPEVTRAHPQWIPLFPSLFFLKGVLAANPRVPGSLPLLALIQLLLDKAMTRMGEKGPHLSTTCHVSSSVLPTSGF